MPLLRKINFSVAKIWLHALSGLMWLGVGVNLVLLAGEWFNQLPQPQNLLYWGVGLISAAGIYFWGFSDLAQKNIHRIDQLPEERPSLFAFQRPGSYFLILFMIGLGITLRKYSPLPKPVLGVLYTGIGGGLGTASLHYFKKIWNRIS